MTITSLFLFISFIFIGIVFIGVGIFFQAHLRSKINQYSIHSTSIVKKKFQVNTYVDNVLVDITLMILLRLQLIPKTR